MPSEGPKADDAARPGKELTAVLGKIIDQLSLSAWMPGIALVAGIAFLAACGRQESRQGELDRVPALEPLPPLSGGAADVGVGP